MDKFKSEDFYTNETTAFMLDMVPALIIIHETAGRIVYANAQACRLHGLSRDEFIGKNVRDFTVGESRSLVKPRLAQATDKRSTFEVRHRHKDGGILNLLINVWPVSFPKGRLLVSIAQDITERKKMETDLKYSEARFRDMCDFMPQNYG